MGSCSNTARKGKAKAKVDFKSGVLCHSPNSVLSSSHFEAVCSSTKTGPQRQSWHGQNVWVINDTGEAGKAPVSSPGADGQLCRVLQVCSERSLANRVLGIRQLKSMHVRLLSSGWHPKENHFLGSPKLFTTQAWVRWRQSYQEYNYDRAGLAELRQTVIFLRMAEAQPTNPDDKKHLLQEKSNGARDVERASNGTARRDCC